MATKYYQYITDVKDTTCETCSKNNGRVFLEETVPTLPVHPNCNCKIILLEVNPKNSPSKKDIKSPTMEKAWEPIVPRSLNYLTKLEDVISVMNESSTLAHISDDAIDLLIKYEMPWQPKYLIKDIDGNVLGIKPHEIGDGGVTIGFGHYISYKELLNNYEAQMLASKNLSIEEAVELLKSDLIWRENHVFKIMQDNEIYLTQNEFDALTLMTYNLGNINFLIEFLKTGNRNRDDWIEIITIRMEPNRRTNFYNGLMNRRYQEIDLILYSDYNGGPDVKKYP